MTIWPLGKLECLFLEEIFALQPPLQVFIDLISEHMIYLERKQLNKIVLNFRLCVLCQIIRSNRVTAREVEDFFGQTFANCSKLLESFKPKKM